MVFVMFTLVARFATFAVFTAFMRLIVFSGGAVFEVFAVFTIIPTLAFIGRGCHCHIPGLVKSTRSAIGESHIEFLGELALECHNFFLVVVQLLLEHGDMVTWGSGDGGHRGGREGRHGGV